jgi:hypothetical protein
MVARYLQMLLMIDMMLIDADHCAVVDHCMSASGPKQTLASPSFEVWE